VKVIVLCVWGQLFCSANSAAKQIAGNVIPGGTVDCLITSLSGSHRRHLCQDLEVRLYVFVDSVFKMSGHSQTLPIKNQSLCGLGLSSLISCIAFLKLFGFLLCSNSHSYLLQCTQAASKLRIFNRNFSQNFYG